MSTTKPWHKCGWLSGCRVGFVGFHALLFHLGDEMFHQLGAIFHRDSEMFDQFSAMVDRGDEIFDRFAAMVDRGGEIFDLQSA